MEIRHDWDQDEVEALFAKPFLDLVYEAQTIHRRYHSPNTLQRSTLLSIKTGGCPEDCAYCPQSVHYETPVDSEDLMLEDDVAAAAKKAKEAGATRLCMGAAWRTPPSEHRFQQVLTMIKVVRDMGLETCATLGMLDASQARRLREAGLDYYNHNLDTSPEFYGSIISTRTYRDRLETLGHVREAGLRVCCGGIVGLGETDADICSLLVQLATMNPHPDSVPINALVAVEGTPLADQAPADTFRLIRTIACARILMPKAYVRLSAGRRNLSDEAHALAFLAGANSMFSGDKLLTTPNPDQDRDLKLMRKLGIVDEQPAEPSLSESPTAPI